MPPANASKTAPADLARDPLGMGPRGAPLASGDPLIERHIEERVREIRESANNQMLKFTSIVAHDLRAPLTRVEAFVAVLREDYASSFDSTGYDVLHRIDKAVHRMKTTLSALLEYSKFGRTALQGKTAHLPTTIEDALTTFDMVALDARVAVRIETTDLIKGDPMLIAHVLQNLIGNATKFRRAETLLVEIIAVRREAMIEITVADNGIGIEPEFADKVFEMFYRLHNEGTYEGTGIGLTLCRKIVNDHDGEIHLDTEYSGGARIVMTLPAAGPDNAAGPDALRNSGEAVKT